VAALVWPGPTAPVLVYLVGAWAVATGIVEFGLGFAPMEALPCHLLARAWQSGSSSPEINGAGHLPGSQ